MTADRDLFDEFPNGGRIEAHPGSRAVLRVPHLQAHPVEALRAPGDDSWRKGRPAAGLGQDRPTKLLVSRTACCSWLSACVGALAPPANLLKPVERRLRL